MGAGGAVEFLQVLKLDALGGRGGFRGSEVGDATVAARPAGRADPRALADRGQEARAVIERATVINGRIERDKSGQVVKMGDSDSATGLLLPWCRITGGSSKGPS